MHGCVKGDDCGRGQELTTADGGLESRCGMRKVIVSSSGIEREVISKSFRQSGRMIYLLAHSRSEMT